MDDTINFGDNLYYFKMRVKILGDGVKLDLSDDLLKNKLITDLEETAAALDWIHKSLEARPNLISRDRYLLDLSRLMRLYSNTVTAYGESGYLDSYGNKSILEEKARLLNFAGTEILHQVDDSEKNQEKQDSLEIISNSELELLLHDDP